MAFHIRDAQTDALVRKLADKHRIGLTDAVRFAVVEQLQREQDSIPLTERIAQLRARVLKRPPTGLDDDKAFYDDLSGNL